VNVAAWDEGRKIVQRAKLFSAGGFVLLLLLSVYAGASGNLLDAAYFAVLSVASLALYFYVRKTFRVRESSPYSVRKSTQRR